MHDHSPPRTLHAWIRGDLEARILSGDLAVGQRIPPERELMTQYGCSRMTVNKAVSALVVDGLITRNRRAGSFVARPQIHSAVLKIPDIPQEIEAGGGSYEYVCLEMEPREACCEHLGAEGHTLGESLFIRSVHRRDGAPLVLEERHIFLTAVPAAREIDFRVTPPGTWLLSHVPWTEAEHHISALVADAAIAQALAVEPGSACLVVDRRTWQENRTLTRVRLVFRGDAYHLTARFGPNTG